MGVSNAVTKTASAASAMGHTHSARGRAAAVGKTPSMGRVQSGRSARGSVASDGEDGEYYYEEGEEEEPLEEGEEEEYPEGEEEEEEVEDEEEEVPVHAPKTAA